MRSVLRVKRQGNACTVYVNPDTDQPLSMTSFDDEVVGGFPKSMMLPEVEARWGGTHKIEYLDPPGQTAPPVSSVEFTDEEITKIEDEGARAAEAYKKKHGVTGDAFSGRRAELKARLGIAPQPTGGATAPAPTYSVPSPTFDPSQAVLRELEVMFAKRGVAAGKAKKELDVEINAVCNFLVRMFPNMLAPLQALAERYKHEQRVKF